MNLKKSKKILFICFFCFCLCGCQKEKPAYHEVAQNGIEVINAIEEGLPAECKSESNKILFNVARKEMRNVEGSCDLAVSKVESEKLRWKWAVFGLLMVIGLYIAKKVLK